jgi:D-lyxose ketol-isomerase
MVIGLFQKVKEEDVKYMADEKIMVMKDDTQQRPEKKQTRKREIFTMNGEGLVVRLFMMQKSVNIDGENCELHFLPVPS